MTLSSDVDVARLLMALGEQFAAARIRYELVVIGGSALLATGLTRRATRDVDLVSLLDGGALIDPRPLPDSSSPPATASRPTSASRPAG